MLLYIGVAIVAVGAAGVEQLQAATTEKAAPLEVVARKFPLRVHWLVAIGAMTAMLGVLLNLILGLSRVLLAMGRRGDMPTETANVTVSVLIVGSIIATLAAIGSIKTTWTFSSFTVLIYYAITNLAALRLKDNERLFNRAWAWGGLVACLALAFAVEPCMWAAGFGMLSVGLVWHFGLRLTAQ
jgi:APA family basic amino acid/polyamine antiporter